MVLTQIFSSWQKKMYDEKFIKVRKVLSEKFGQPEEEISKSLSESELKETKYPILKEFHNALAELMRVNINLNNACLNDEIPLSEVRTQLCTAIQGILIPLTMKGKLDIFRRVLSKMEDADILMKTIRDVYSK
jgi:hypothetical protein